MARRLYNPVQPRPGTGLARLDRTTYGVGGFMGLHAAHRARRGSEDIISGDLGRRSEGLFRSVGDSARPVAGLSTAALAAVTACPPAARRRGSGPPWLREPGVTGRRRGQNTAGVV